MALTRLKEFMTNLFRVLLGLAILALMLVLTVENTAAQTASTLVAGEAVVRVLQSDLDGVLLELSAPLPHLAMGDGELSLYETVLMSGFEVSDVPGAPQLPVRGVSVGVPAGSEVDLRVWGVAQQVLPGAHFLAPAPTRGMEVPPPDQWQLLLDTGTLPRTVTFAQDPAIYGADAYYPASPVRLAEVGQIRSQRVALVEFHPVQANPMSGELLYTSRAVVELTFRHPQGVDLLAGREAVPEVDSFERLLAESLVNYETARAWRMPRAPLVPAFLEGTPDPGYKVVVRKTGIYELTYTDLADAGLPVDTLDPAMLQIFHHDQEMAIYVAGEGDGSFDPGDYLLFYGEAIQGKYLKYTDDNVYVLTFGQEVHLPMSERNGAPPPAGASDFASFEETMHFETDEKYRSLMSGEDDDFARWYWAITVAPGEIEQTVVLTDVMPVTLADPLTASLRVSMYGYQDATHFVTVTVNPPETELGGFQWSGKRVPYLAEYEFDQGLLFSGTGNNTVRLGAILTGTETTSYPYLDWFEIDYHRAYRADGDVLAYTVDGTGVVVVDDFTSNPVGVEDLTTFDVTDPLSVTRVLGTVWEDNGLGQYQMRFANTVDGLQRFWTGLPGERLSPVSIELDNPSDPDLKSTANGADYIMISHADFITDVAELRDFYNAPDFRTVLVDVQDVYDEFSGGVFYPSAIRDFLAYAYDNWQAPAPSYVLLVGDGHYDFKGTAQGQYIPPYLAYVDLEIGETVADNRYVCVAGDDIFPDMALGRFPVNSRAEAQAMVSRSINYQQNPAPGDWNQRLLFVTDNDDGGGNFAEDYSDPVISETVPITYTTVTTIYYGTADYPTGSQYVDQMTAAIKTAISEGQLFVSYIGHAAISWWAHEKFFDTGDVGGLTNGDMLPIMLPMTCQEGFYARTSSSGLSEVIVRMTSGGAVASWAPTGWGVAKGHDYLEKGFLDAVFNQGIDRLGDATTAGKLNLWNGTTAYRDLIDTYVLLGDPALKINLPEELDPTGVSLASFTASLETATSVILRWETLTEVDTVGFHLYRARVGDAVPVRINGSLIASRTPPGSLSGAAYEFADDRVEAGVTYDYWLEEVDVYGQGTRYGPVQLRVPVVSGPEYRIFLPAIHR
jgi:hypothetical protein